MLDFEKMNEIREKIKKEEQELFMKDLPLKNKQNIKKKDEDDPILFLIKLFKLSKKTFGDKHQ